MSNSFLYCDNEELINFSKQFKTAADTSYVVIKSALKHAAQRFLEDVKQRTPVKTGNLRDHWDLDNANVVVQEDSEGFFILLVNTSEYAEWVEKGHYSYNQFGGPYIVKNRKVPYFEGNNDKRFVYGVFYLRKTEIQYDMGKLDNLIEIKFNQWLKDILEGGNK